MSVEILEQVSEEFTEEELSEKAKAKVEQDSSDEPEDEEEVEESKTAKASTKKEGENPFAKDGDDEDEDDVEESADVARGDKNEDGRDDSAAEIDPSKAKLKKESAVPKTKNGMLKAVYEIANGLKKDQLSAKYEQIIKALSIVEQEEGEEDEEEASESKRTKAAAVKAEDLQIDVKDDITALTEGEDDLTDEFKEKTSTIFEAAVRAKVIEEVNKKVEEIEKRHDTEQEAHSENFQKELTEKVDGYLTYVVEEWMKENELAIERGIRSELVEDFMSGLKTLFSEHYIDIPEEKVDMVDDLFAKVDDLESSLDEEINRGIELQKELSKFKKEDALKEVTKDLADTETEKIEKLAEGIEYENAEQYAEKLSVLKESYFPKGEAVTSEITETDENIEVQDEENVQLDENMKYYTSAISRYHN